MACQLDKVKRALVSLMKPLAKTYHVVLAVTRDSVDQEITSAYRKLSRRVHPDKGGSVADQKRLNSAHDAWKEERARAAGHGGA